MTKLYKSTIYYTDEEDAIVRAHCDGSQGSLVKCAAMLPGRSTQSVKRRIARLRAMDKKAMEPKPVAMPSGPALAAVEKLAYCQAWRRG